MEFIYIFFPNLILIVFAYLMGSVIYGNLISKIFFKKDIKKENSKNPGAANMGRTFGVKIGVLVWSLDCSKVVIVMLISLILANFNHWLSFDFFSKINVALIGACSVIGHVYPVYYKFKGGKGFSSLIGYILFLSNWFILYLLVIYAVLVQISKIISVCSMTTAWTSAFFSFIPGLRYSHYIGTNAAFNAANPWWIASIILIILAGLITYAHKENIKKLINKKENAVQVEKFWILVRNKLAKFTKKDQTKLELTKEENEHEDKKDNNLKQ